MKKILLTLAGGWLCVACGPSPAPPMAVAVSCTVGDLTVEIERGSAKLEVMQTREDSCLSTVHTLAFLRGLYEERFGRQDLTDWRVRVRAMDELTHTGPGVVGSTSADAIDLGVDHIGAFPHELNHVRTGSGHAGWCIDFEPWSEEVLGINARTYLGCN